MMDVITALIVSALTLCAWSLLYRENIFYHFTEALVVGFGMGYTLYIALDTLNKIWLKPLISGKLWLIIPAILGFLLFTVFSKKYMYLSRWSIATIAGTGTGYAVSRAVPVMIIRQIEGLGKPLAQMTALETINHIIVIITCIGTIAYFTFTRPHVGPLGKLAKIGRWSMMIAFGSTFGATLFANQVFVIERCAFLAKYPQNILLIVAILFLLYDFYRRRK